MANGQPTTASQQAAQHIIRFLASTELFQGVDEASLARIASATVAKEYVRGRVVLRQGEEGGALFIIARGRVAVVVEDTEIGMERVVAELGEMEVFGEMSVLLDEPRAATVRAATDTMCVILSREAFQRIVIALPQVGLTVSRNLARRLADQNRSMGFRFVRLSEQAFDSELYGLFSAELLEQHQAVPLYTDGHLLTVAMTRPYDRSGVDSLRTVVPGVKVQPVACGEEEYRAYLEEVIGPAIGDQTAGGSDRVSAALRASYSASDVSFVEAETGALGGGEIPGEAVVRLFNEILVDAVNRGASDIHIEPAKDALRVRLRVDGRLISYRRGFQRRFHAPLVSRIKIMGGMDISERRRPQDGRASYTIADKTIDARISTLATLHGEKIVLRLLDAGAGMLPLEKLILSKQLAGVVRRAVSKTTGGVVIVGPTGSGKTTTLYSALNERKSQANDLNIVTVEDPIEYTVDGITQTQVSHAPGLGFAGVLRALLRQDPDVIMIGETRDAETAQIALEGALTGHLVLTTLHADGTVEAATRLVDMGCPAYLVASAIDLVCAQRLMRKICPHCRGKHQYSEIVRVSLDRSGVLPMNESEVLFKGRGCPRCQTTGFMGRVGAYEVLQLTDSLREAIGLGESEATIRRMALETRSMTSFPQYAGFLLRTGLTSPAEALRLFA